MGAPPSLEDMYREHHAFVWRIVRRLGVPDAAVDDAVQEVFVVLHRRQGEFDLSGSVRALLYGIARKVGTRARERAARASSHLRVAEDTAVDTNDPQRTIEVREQAAVLRDALDAMDEGKRMTFVLADIEGMPMPEIAECLGANLNTAYARLRAARQLVRKAIERHRAREEGDHVRTRSRPAS